MFNLSKTTRAPTDGAAPPREKASPPGIFPPGQRKLILVVDDNAVTRVLMGTRLRDAGFAAEIATITPSTVDRARQLRPDAVTLNLNQHEKAGLELVRHLRKALPDSDIPVFALSDLNVDRILGKAEKIGLSRVFRNTGSRPHEVIKALQEWFAPSSSDTSSSSGTTMAEESARPSNAAPASPLDSVDGTTTGARVAAVRRELETVALCTRLEQQPQALTALLAAVESLTVNARHAGQADLARVSAALAGLVQEFTTTPGGLNPARRHLLGRALELLQTPGRFATSGAPTAERLAILAGAPSGQCTTMTQALQSHGFSSRHFDSHAAAWPFLERNPADLLVLKINSPGATSCDLAASIRQMPQHESTPLLFINTRDDPEAASRIGLYGPSDLIVEPMTTAEFLFKAITLVYQRPLEQPAKKGQRTSRVAAPGRALMTAAARSQAGETNSLADTGSEDAPILDLESATRGPAGGEFPESLLRRRGLLHVDESWGICSINDDGAALLGCPVAAGIGRNLREWIILGLPASPAEAWSNANPFNSDSGTAIMSLILRRQDSSILPARFRLQKLGDGSNTRWLVMLSPESAPGNGNDTTLFTKAAFAVDHPEDPVAQVEAAADAQTDLLRRRLDELLTISTDEVADADIAGDAACAQDAGEVAASPAPLESTAEIGVTPAEAMATDSLSGPAVDVNRAPAGSATDTESPAELPVEILPEEPAVTEIERLEPAATEAIASTNPSNDPATMKPNLEPAHENSANAEAPLDANTLFAEETRELCQQLDEARQEIADLEARLEASMTALAAATAQFQREQSERRRQEQRAAQFSKRLEDLHEDLRQHLQSESTTLGKISALEDQLGQRGETAAQLLADIEREIAEKAALREDRDALAEFNQALRGQIQHLEAAVTELGVPQQDLEQRLQTSTTALAEAKAATARAVEERVRLEAEVSLVRTEGEAELRRAGTELARVRAALQVETLHRHRVESEALQARSRLGETERAGSSAVTRLQSRLRAPVSALVQSLGRLLEKDLPPEHRELAEAVLTNAALVQTSLQELGGGLNARRPSGTQAPVTEGNLPPARTNADGPLQSSGQPTGTAPTNARQF